MLEKILRSKAGVKILGTALFIPGLHMREIARTAGVSPFEAKRELDTLVDIGLLTRTKSGNQIIFNPNQQCPFLLDLKNIYQKTEGFFSQLRESLTGLEIQYAFVFGSMANGTETSRSDTDLLLIGDESDQRVSETIFKIQKYSNREINFILWTHKDFEGKLRTKNAFLSSIIKKKIWIMGDEDEFGRIVKERLGKKNRTK